MAVVPLLYARLQWKGRALSDYRMADVSTITVRILVISTCEHFEGCWLMLCLATNGDAVARMGVVPTHMF